MTRVSELFGTVQRDLQILIDTHIEESLAQPRAILRGWDAKARWDNERGMEIFRAEYNITLGLYGIATPGVTLGVTVTQFVDSGDVELVVGPQKSCEGTELAHIDSLRPVANGLAARVHAYLIRNRFSIGDTVYNPYLITEKSYKGLPSEQPAAAATSATVAPAASA